MLGDDGLGDGEEVNIHFNRNETAAKWDLKIVDEDGDTVIWKGLSLLKIRRVTLFYKDKTPTAEVE